MRALLAKLVFVHLGPVWNDIRIKLPRVHRFLSKAGRLLFPWSRRVWMKSGGGIAAGLYFKLNPRFEKEFLESGDERSETVWTSNLVPGAVFYDVGSHIGVFAVSGARLIGREGAVYAFEPDPRNARLIRENAGRNSLAVEVVSAAAWKYSGQLAFLPSSESDPSRMGGRLVAAGDSGRSISVNAISLDDFAAAHRPPTFIKLDVEGAEAEVIEGARKTLLRHRPNLLIEIHNDEAFRRVSRLLDDCGYSFERTGDRLLMATAMHGPLSD